MTEDIFLFLVCMGVLASVFAVACAVESVLEYRRKDRRVTYIGCTDRYRRK